MSTKLIIGLGNIGDKFTNTRHNIGFHVVEELATKLDPTASFSKHGKASALVADLKAAHGVLIVKPTTMMNLSGGAVSALAKYYSIEPADVWVVHDEADLLFGVLRTRLGGSSAGHNGIKSITQNIGEGYWRFRLGIRNRHFEDTPTDQFVLDNFTKDELRELAGITDKTADILLKFLSEDQATETSANLT